jgi:hypothetical protein
MKNNNKIEIGDTFIVEMLKNKKLYRLPICRCNGRVGFINPKTKVKPLIGEIWLVSVIEIKGTFLIVEPCLFEMSIAENEKNKQEAMKKLVTIFKKKKAPKVKKQYPYLTKQELL